MSIALRCLLVLGVLAYMTYIFISLKKKRFDFKYSLMWMFSAVVMLIFAIFPQLGEIVSHLLGIQSPVNAIFLIFLVCILVMLISITSIVSKQHRQIKTLIQNLALLEKKLEDKNQD